MKEFIIKWSNWWRFNPKREQLDDAFEKELNELIEREVALLKHDASGSLLKDWQAWEDCILSFLMTYPKIRHAFNKHVDDWNTHTPLPQSAYERGEQ